MTPVLAALGAFFAYACGYRFYSGFLAKRIYALDDKRVTPAHTLRDDVDYIPTRPVVLFGHHFASITGLAPMLGPAIAVIWGWAPAMLWVVFGAIFVGCVHDFSALVLSVRARGMSVGMVAQGVISGRARTLFHLIIFFGISLAMGVFVYVISVLVSVELAPGHPGYPQAVLPSGILMAVAIVAGFLMHKRGLALVWVAVVGFGIELFGIWLGARFPTIGFDPSSWPERDTWTWILLGYAFLASVLPVWSLLQSRDFLNSLLLYLGLGLAYLGLFVGQPTFAAPAFVANPEGAPSILPFVFIVIACGAASGFHGLVSSGTTAKQLDQETHARKVGYGGMIGESLLGLLAVLACTAGFSNADVWQQHYSSWGDANGLPGKIDAFIQGTTSFLVSLGLPTQVSAALIAMVVVSFALTTLDSATRLLRFNVEEIASSALRLPIGPLRPVVRAITNRYLSSALACASIAFFAFYKVQVGERMKPAALALWTLFGTTNQLLAGLILILATLYLKHRGRPIWFTAIPAVFMLGSTSVAMIGNLIDFAPGGASEDFRLFVVGGCLALLAVWLVFESIAAFVRPERVDSLDIELSGSEERPA